MDLEKKYKRRALLLAGAGTLAALGGAVAVWSRRRARPTAGAAVALKARQVEGDLPVTDPEHADWKKAPSATLNLLPQQLFYPWLHQATIPEVTVRALYNGTQLAFQVEWQDPSKDELESALRFRDACAVMLPMQPNGQKPAIFMSSAGQPVYILQWKASWQLDMEKGFQGVEASVPNWFNDVYPGHPTLEQLGMDAGAARQFYPGLAAGNNISQQQRVSPVEELVAEGFGTLTTLPQQRAQGRGVFAGGRWKVSLGLPASGPDVPALQPGLTVPVAFAVWDGGKRQVGGRKHYADWIDLILPGG